MKNNFFNLTKINFLLILFFIVMSLPYIFAIFFSLNINSIENHNIFQSYLDMYASHRIEALSTIVTRSLIISTLSIVIAFLFCYFLIYHFNKKITNLLLILISIPLLLNPGIRAFAWLDFFKQTIGLELLYHYDMGLTIAMMSVTIVFPIFAIYFSFITINKNVWSSATDLGASTLKKIQTVVIPNVLPGIIIGWIGSFSLNILSSIEVKFLTQSKISLSFIFNDLLSANKTEGLFVISMSFIFVYIVWIYFIYQWILHKYIEGSNV